MAASAISKTVKKSRCFGEAGWGAGLSCGFFAVYKSG